jgi:hypothetical protein
VTTLLLPLLLAGLPEAVAAESWFQPIPGGVRQGWTFQAPPSQHPSIVLPLRISGAQDWWVQPNRVDVRIQGAGQLWHYDDLHAWDSTGRALPAAFFDVGETLEIRVDTRGAVYPVHVDPDLSSEQERVSPDPTGYEYFGSALATLGDVDGDGFQDVAVGGRGEDKVYLYYGSATGTEWNSPYTLSPQDTGWVDNYGYSVSAAGDLNDDGYDDVLVGASGYKLDEGRLFVYYGAATGVSVDTEQTVEASDAGNADGYSKILAALGDVDGDGYDDIGVGAPSWNNDQGALYFYFGSSTGLSAESEDIFEASNAASDSYFGGAISRAGDVDGDGYDDVLVGASGATSGASTTDVGAGYLYYGSFIGLSRSSEQQIDSSDGSRWDLLGASVVGGEDLDQDGYLDVVLGAPGESSSTGAIYIYYGSASGFVEDKHSAVDPGAGDLHGAVIALLPDLSGDGYADLAVSSTHDEDGSLRDAGSVFIYYGSASGVLTGIQSKVSPASPARSSNFGSYLLSLGDDDGDGFDELLVGVPRFTGSTGGSGVLVQFDGSCIDDDLDGSCYPQDCDDSDADISPSEKVDSCGDGVDQDCDGLGGGGEDADEDEDGLTLAAETLAELSDCESDSDGDGLLDGDEVNIYGTDPLAEDSDGDGLSDWDEVKVYGTNPVDRDSDGDKLGDQDEVEKWNTDPNNKDSDADGILDGEEINSTDGRTDPLNPDSDGDGLLDGEERYTYDSDPNKADTDGDELDDGAEIEAGSDPNVRDTDGGGVLDGYEVLVDRTDPTFRDDDLSDWDNDGLMAWEEEALGTNPYDADSDDDGIPDGEDDEPMTGQTQEAEDEVYTVEYVPGCGVGPAGPSRQWLWVFALVLLGRRRKER